MPCDGYLNPRDFGAKGDGKSDDSAALQKTLDAAREKHMAVFLPPGAYRAANLKLRARTGLCGVQAWKYRQEEPADFGSALLLSDPAAPCLLDLSEAVGCTINGIALDGGLPRDDKSIRSAQGPHGMLVKKQSSLGPEEDILRIERCKVSRFAGDGIHFDGIWCCNLRHNMVAFNAGHALRLNGCDGFFMDNWLSGNGGAGIITEGFGACHTITANRIEWNREGGIVLSGAKHYNLTGNFIDRSGKCGIRILADNRRTSEVFTITGNIIWRSGRPEWVGNDPLDSAQLRFEEAQGLVCTGNALNVWRDDGPRGTFSPRHGIVCRALQSSVVRDNTLHGGAVEKLVLDLGGHDDQTIIRDNPGTLFTHPDMKK